MNKLLRRYLDDSLTIEELEALKTKINNCTDKQLESELDKLDSLIQVENNEPENIPDVDFNSIFEGRLTKSDLRPATYMRIRKSLLWVAAILLPVLLISSIYFCNESLNYRAAAKNDIVFATGRGERATAILPDGTTVSLNYLSRLSYNLVSFNSENRLVTFSGEGYFKVAHDQNAPFTIKTSDFEVNVLGTIFNLSARLTDNYGELVLESGEVDIKYQNQSISMKSGQIAIVDYSQKKIELSDFDKDKVTSWRKGDIIFYNTSLEKVLKILSDSYGRKIVLDSKSKNLSSKFSGRIPNNDLNEALNILEYTYNLRSIHSSEVITLKD